MDMDESRGLGQLLGERLKEFREERGLTPDDVARQARQVGLPWSRFTVHAFERGQRKQVVLEELLLLSYAFQVEPSDWFAGNGWVKLSDDARASLGVIRSMLAGSSPTAHWTRISERQWDLPEFKDAPGILHAQFEWMNAKLRRVKEALGEGATTETAIRAVEAAARPAEVKAAYKFQVEPLDVSTAAFRSWGRSLTQERDQRFGEAARMVSFKKLRESRRHITRHLLRELAPSVKRKKLASPS